MLVSFDTGHGRGVEFELLLSLQKKKDQAQMVVSSNTAVSFQKKKWHNTAAMRS